MLLHRKKHGKYLKDDIESAIGYNKYVSEQSSVMDSFHSPDTVCKYCGVDFKFFRALKHHLRSHSSCRQKPFQCTMCDIGFSTKANCIRHLQKQHTELPQNEIEAHILVNEPSAMDDGEKSLGEMSFEDSLSDRDSNTPLSTTSTVPPAAHTTPHLTPSSSQHVSPSIKMEPMDLTDNDAPLDFSKKSFLPEVKNTPVAHDDDAPMDLSIKKKPESELSSSSSKVL